VFGLACWRVIWTGRPPRSLRGAAAGQGWRGRLRDGLEQVPTSRADPAIVLTVSGLFVGFLGLLVLGDVIAVVGYSAAGIFGLLAVSVALFRRPRSLIPPYRRDSVDRSEG
jgi:hypothetical protein